MRSRGTDGGGGLDRDLIEAGLKEGADRIRRSMGIVEPVHERQRRREPRMVPSQTLVEAGRRSRRRPMGSHHTPSSPERMMTGVEVDGTRAVDKPCRGSLAGRAYEYL